MTQQFDTYERWDVDTFTFVAMDRLGHDDETDPRKRVDYVEVTCSWNDWPREVGIYALPITVEELKQHSKTWLLNQLDQWHKQAEAMSI